MATDLTERCEGPTINPYIVDEHLDNFEITPRLDSFFRTVEFGTMGDLVRNTVLDLILLGANENILDNIEVVLGAYNLQLLDFEDAYEGSVSRRLLDYFESAETVTKKHVQEMLGVHHKKFNQWIEAGYIPKDVFPIHRY